MKAFFCFVFVFLLEYSNRKVSLRVIHCVAHGLGPCSLVAQHDKRTGLQHGCTKQLPCWYLRHCRSHVGADRHIPLRVMRKSEIAWLYPAEALSPCDGMVHRWDKYQHMMPTAGEEAFPRFQQLRNQDTMSQG